MKKAINKMKSGPSGIVEMSKASGESGPDLGTELLTARSVLL